MSHRHGASYCGCLALITFSLAGCSDDPATGPTGPTVIRDVRVFDGTTAIPRATVMIQGDRIVEVGATVSAASGATIIEGAGKTLLPGLIDAHAHVSHAAQLEQSTLFGATTVLDMGCGDPQLGAALRKSSGEPGSKLAELRFGGYGVTTPRGHCTEFGFPVPTLTEPSEVQSFVDARIAEGSDYIKIIYDDGRAYGIEFATISKETLVAAVEAAHRRAKLAIVHVGTFADARDAIEAGADGLAHLFVDRSPDPDFGSLLASHGAFAMPTLSVLRMVTGSSVGPSVASDPLIAPYLSTYAINGLNQTFPPPPKPVEMSYAAVEESVRLLKAASVPLLAGSDAPNPGTTHGATVHSELRLLVAAGLTPIEALAAATSLPAQRFGLTDRGHVAPAMRADLVLVNGDPTADIAVTTHIEAVWKGGVRFDREAYRLRK